jgi:hypothetical protein
MNLERTDLIVWVDGNEEWDRVYMEKGKLYIIVSDNGVRNYVGLENFHIDRIQDINKEG